MDSWSSKTTNNKNSRRIGGGVNRPTATTLRRGRPVEAAYQCSARHRERWSPIQLDPGLRQAVEARAEADHATREAVRRFLDVV